MNRRFRAFAALAAIAAFLFAQAATSAYACAAVPDPVSMAQMKAQMKAQMEDDGGLCEKHCVTGTVSLDIAKPANATMPALVAVPVRLIVVAPVALAVPTRAAPRSVAGPAPPLIRFTVLRI